MMQCCSRFKVFIGLMLFFGIVNHFCLNGSMPPPPDRKRSRGADSSTGYRDARPPRARRSPVAAPLVIGERFASRDVAYSVRVFLKRCHVSAVQSDLVLEGIGAWLREKHPDDFGDMTQEIPPLSVTDVEAIFQEFLLPLIEQCDYYTGPLPTVPVLPLGSTPVSGTLMGPDTGVLVSVASLPRSPRKEDMITGGPFSSPSRDKSLTVGGPFSSPQCSVSTARRVLPVMTPDRSIVDEARRIPSRDIMDSFICHILCAPPTCVDLDLYNFISWLFTLDDACVHSAMRFPYVPRNKTCDIFLSVICGQLAADMGMPEKWYKSALDNPVGADYSVDIDPIAINLGRIEKIKESIQQVSEGKRRRYAAPENQWLGKLMAFVGTFVNKDEQIHEQVQRLSTSPPSMLSLGILSPPNYFTNLAMKILGFYCFKHMQNIPPDVQEQFTTSRFVEIYGHDDREEKTGLLRNIKACGLPMWLLIPFDADNATRITRRLMMRIHQYRMLLDNNTFATQCEWCRRDACSLYMRLHGCVEIFIQRLRAGVAAGVAREKLQAVFDRIQIYLDRLMLVSEGTILIGRAYEDLIIIAKKIARVLGIDITRILLGNCVVIKDDHIRFVVNEREGVGGEGEGGHVFLSPEIQGIYRERPFRYHLHNSINIREMAALYENKRVIGDFRPDPELTDLATGIVLGSWVKYEKIPSPDEDVPLARRIIIDEEPVPPVPTPVGVPEPLHEFGTKLSTLFPVCYSNHIRACYHEHALVCAREHILDYCQKLWNVVQAVERDPALLGQLNSDGCCLLTMQVFTPPDASLMPGEVLVNKMYVFQHPHTYGCLNPECHLRESLKPMIVAMYVWDRSVSVVRQPVDPARLATPIEQISITKIASVYPLLYFDRLRDAAKIDTLLGPMAGTLPVVTPPSPPTNLAPEDFVLRCGTETFRLIKHGRWFEKLQ